MINYYYLKGQWKEVVEDCDKSLNYDRVYQKAYARRGHAKLQLKDFENVVLG